MPEQIIYRTEGLHRSFQSGRETIAVLQDINLVVPRQSLTMFKGRSGSGKTTLINLLGALDRPTAGRIFFPGQRSHRPERSPARPAAPAPYGLYIPVCRIDRLDDGL